MKTKLLSSKIFSVIFVFCALLFFTQVHATDIVSNLQLYLKLNETSGTTTNDESVNNNDGTLKASAIFATGGYADGCVSFNGSNGSEITVPAHASINNPSSITVNIWFKPAVKGIEGAIL